MKKATPQQLSEIIMARIKNGMYPVGEKLPSERDLAEELQTGRALVRIALDQLLSDKWLEMPSPRIRVVSKTAPTPLYDRRSGMIGMMGAVRTITERNPEKMLVSEKRIIGAAHAVGELALASLQLPWGDEEKLIVSALRETMPKGLIYFNEDHICDDLVATVLAPRMPVVSFGDTSFVSQEKLPFDTVGSDHCEGAKMLIKALYEMGCRKILRFCSGAAHNWRRERRKGALEGCKEFDIEEFSEVKKILAPTNYDDPDLFEHHTKMIAGQLMEFVRDPQKRPDAIMLETDADLAYVGRALQHLGVEPNRDILLSGYDNYWRLCPEQRWCNIHPVITVDKDDIDIGRQAVKLLLKRINNLLPEEKQHLLIKSQLVEVVCDFRKKAESRQASAAFA